jgi:uncharacterized protein (TIGR02145 family)
MAFNSPYTVQIADNGKKIRYFATNSCGTTYSNVVVVTVNPLPVIANIALNICGNSTFNYTPTTGVTGNGIGSDIVPSGTKYTWTVTMPNSVGATAQSLSANYVGEGQTLVNNTPNPITIRYTVLPTAGSNCQGNSFYVDVTVATVNSVKPSFTFNDVEAFCNLQPLDLTALTVATGSISGLNLTYYDNTFTPVPNPTAVEPGTYKIIGTNSAGCTETATVTYTWVPTGEIQDIDNNTYNVISLAGLCWTENMKTTRYADGRTIPFAEPYSNPLNLSIDYTEIFGLLYSWYSATDLSEGDPLPTGDVQGICPNGWHIPTRAELASLEAFSAEELMSSLYWIQVNGTNDSEFSALPAGFFNSTTGTFNNLFGFAGFWSYESVSTKSYCSCLNYNCDIIKEITMMKADGLSVRCVGN